MKGGSALWLPLHKARFEADNEIDKPSAHYAVRINPRLAPFSQRGPMPRLLARWPDVEDPLSITPTISLVLPSR